MKELSRSKISKKIVRKKFSEKEIKVKTKKARGAIINIRIVLALTED